jgi:simple sugar transport system ATP-binding protein
MEDISVEFPGVRALREVCFCAEGGQAHALVGANGAGKSTLIKVLAGAHPHYQGRIRLGGAVVRIRSPRDARALGIQVVHQEVDTALIPALSVAENVMVDSLAAAGHFGVRWRRLRKEASRALALLGVSLDPRRRLDHCSLAEKQLVLLARALVSDCRVLVLDEPTAPLGAAETERLFRVIRDLLVRGVAVIFVSHRLAELSHVCEVVTVLRDGRVVGRHPLRALEPGELVRLMLGRPAEEASVPTRPAPPGRPLLQVCGLSDGGRLHDVDLMLRAGEVVGLAGLVGAGKTELCKALYGAIPARWQAATLGGAHYDPGTPAMAVRRGLALIPEERRAEGVLVQERVATNLTAASLSACTGRLGFLRRGAERVAAAGMVKRLAIRTASLRQPVAQLSGGNQQKVVIGKWLLADAEVYLFDEPTKGVDVGARRELFGLVAGLAEAGKAVLYVSSEPAELLAVADRICVLREGRVAHEVAARGTSEAELHLLCSGAGREWA